MSDLLKTPLSSWHESHGAKMAPFAGWYMPIQYEGILAEHEQTRTKASLFDICHMGEFTFRGPGAEEAMARAVTHQLATLKIGRCRYGFILAEDGGVLDDCIIYHVGQDDFFVVVNAACIDRDYKTLCSRMPASIECRDISAATGKIDLQGPLSVDILEAFLGAQLHDLPYFAFRDTTWNGKPLRVSRTGYTGELGYELYIPADSVVALWEALLGDSRVKPAGLGARDTLRLECGLALYGHELDEKHTPIESGMAGMMKSEADYVGKKGLSRITERLIPLELAGRRAVRNGDSLALPGGPVVGRITSGSFAPSLGKVIAMAWVAAEHADKEDFEVVTPRARLAAHKTVLPFYKKGTARTKLQAQ